MILGMVLNLVKMPKDFLENFKAVKRRPISKSPVTPTDLHITGTFEVCGLHDFLKGLSV